MTPCAGDLSTCRSKPPLNPTMESEIKAPKSDHGGWPAQATEEKPEHATPTPPLKIFLSHKLGKSREKAIRVAAALSVLANERIEIIYSANFDRGDFWEQKIRAGLDEANWFILLYDGPDVNHDWCLFEAGYFRATMKEDVNKKLFCLHDPRHVLPPPLRGFTSVPAKEDELHQLFRQIYLDEPWQIKPALFAEIGHVEIREKISRIIREVLYEEEIIAQFTISPTFTFHVDASETVKLGGGSISPNTQVSGDGPWETAFGRPERSTAWTWGELTENLEDWQPWAYQLASMMSDALRYTAVRHPSIALRIRTNDGSESIYRVILRRLEKTKDECRFTFAAAKIITAYQPTDHVKETRIFHLYNMAWFFRRQFLEKHLEKLRNLQLAKKPPSGKIEAEVRSIVDDLKALYADAQVRGVEDPVSVIQAFEEPLRNQVSVVLQNTWPQLVERLESACAQQPADLGSLIAAIEAMEEINRFCLKVSLGELIKSS